MHFQELASECYFILQSLCILPPGTQDYQSERCLLSCLPSLHSLGIVDLVSAPCLVALLKNLHLVLHDQYTYEEVCWLSNQYILFLINFFSVHFYNYTY